MFSYIVNKIWQLNFCSFPPVYSYPAFSYLPSAFSFEISEPGLYQLLQISPRNWDSFGVGMARTPPISVTVLRVAPRSWLSMSAPYYGSSPVLRVSHVLCGFPLLFPEQMLIIDEACLWSFVCICLYLGEVGIPYNLFCCTVINIFFFNFCYLIVLLFLCGD